MPQRNNNNSSHGRSAIARRVMFGGPSTNGMMPSVEVMTYQGNKIKTSYFGGPKKSGSVPSATGFMRSTSMLSKISSNAGRSNYLFDVSNMNLVEIVEESDYPNNSVELVEESDDPHNSVNIDGASEDPNRHLKSEIFFGRNYLDGSELSSEKFDKFLLEIVTPLFNGFTMYEAYGQMNDGNKIEKQRTFVIVIIHKNDDKNKEKIKKITDTFKREHKHLQSMTIQYNILPLFHNR